MYFIKKTLKNALYQTMAFEPLLRRVRASHLHDSIVVLMYHEIANDDDEIEAWTVVRKNDFIAQMEYLRKSFSIVSLQEAISLIESNQPICRPTAVITFDDGYSGNRATLMPIINSMEIPVTIFVATKAVQEQIPFWYDELIQVIQSDRIIHLNLKYMSLSNYIINRFKGPRNWNEIERLLRDLKKLKPDKRTSIVKELVLNRRPEREISYPLKPLTVEQVREVSESPFVTIGAHSHCHNILTQLNKNDMRRSVLTSKELLEAWTGKPVRYFSYPNGNYDDTVINSVRSIGFVCGMTTVSRAWQKKDNHFTLPRIGVGRYDSLDYFKMKVSGGLFYNVFR